MFTGFLQGSGASSSIWWRPWPSLRGGSGGRIGSAPPDPLRAPRQVAHQLLGRLMAAMKEDRGVHIDSLLAALAALAGHACQASVREELVEQRGFDERQVFVVLQAPDGRLRYRGELIDDALFDHRHSVWRLVGTRARQLGAEDLPDLRELRAHVGARLLDPDFGLPRWPRGSGAASSPEAYLREHWAAFHALASAGCAAPRQWPIACGLAIVEVMTHGTRAIPPEAALKLVMECALPMSRIALPSGPGPSTSPPVMAARPPAPGPRHAWPRPASAAVAPTAD